MCMCMCVCIKEREREKDTHDTDVKFNIDPRSLQHRQCTDVRCKVTGRQG